MKGTERPVRLTDRGRAAIAAVFVTAFLVGVNADALHLVGWWL